MANHFWRDGGTRKVYIAGVEGLYDPLRLTVRHTTNASIEAFNAQIDGLGGATPETLRKKQAEFIAEHVKAWDAMDDGETAPVTGDNLRMLQPVLYRRVCNVVYGTDGGDADPQATAADPEATATLEEREKN